MSRSMYHKYRESEGSLRQDCGICKQTRFSFSSVLDSSVQSDLQGMHLKYVSWVCDESDEVLEHLSLITLSTLSTYMNFSFSVKRLCPGSAGIHTIVNGMKVGEIDIAGDIVKTIGRTKYVKFLTPLVQDSFVMVIKVPSTRDPADFNLLSPFDTPTWLLAFVYGTAAILLLTVTEKKSQLKLLKNLNCRRTQEKLSEYVTFVCGTFANQGGTYLASSSSARVFIFVWWMFVITILALYTAILVSQLSVNAMEYPFTSLQQAIHSDVMPIVVEKYSGEALLNNAHVAVELLELWHRVTEHPQGIAVSMETAFQLVSTGKYTLINSKVFSEIRMSIEQKPTEPCKFTFAPFELVPTQVGWVTSHNNCISDVLNKGIQALTQSGILNKWLHESIFPTTSCLFMQPQKQVMANSISLQHLYAIFFVLLGGFVVAFLILSIEKLICIRQSLLSSPSTLSPPPPSSSPPQVL